RGPGGAWMSFGYRPDAPARVRSPARRVGPADPLAGASGSSTDGAYQPGIDATVSESADSVQSDSRPSARGASEVTTEMCAHGDRSPEARHAVQVDLGHRQARTVGRPGDDQAPRVDDQGVPVAL